MLVRTKKTNKSEFTVIIKITPSGRFMRPLLSSLMNSLVESVWIDGTGFGLLISFYGFKRYTINPESTSWTFLMINHFCCQHLPPGLWPQRVHHTRMCRTLIQTVAFICCVCVYIYIYNCIFSELRKYFPPGKRLNFTIFCWSPPEKSQHQDAEVIKSTNYP